MEIVVYYIFTTISLGFINDNLCLEYASLIFKISTWILLFIIQSFCSKIILKPFYVIYKHAFWSSRLSSVRYSICSFSSKGIYISA